MFDSSVAGFTSVAAGFASSAFSTGLAFSLLATSVSVEAGFTSSAFSEDTGSDLSSSVLTSEAAFTSSSLFVSASSVVATFSTTFCSFLEESSLLSFFTNSVFSSELGCVGSSEAFTAPPFANIKLRVVPKNTDATPTLYFRKEKRCCSFLIILISSPFILFYYQQKNYTIFESIIQYFSLTLALISYHKSDLTSNNYVLLKSFTLLYFRPF